MWRPDTTLAAAAITRRAQADGSAARALASVDHMVRTLQAAIDAAKGADPWSL